MICRIDVEVNFKKCVSMIKDYDYLRCYTMLYDTVLSFGAILFDTILLFSAILCDPIQFDPILWYVKRYNKKVGWTNVFNIIFHEEDWLVDGKNNCCWKEGRMWWNVVKDIEASGESIFVRENKRRSDS